MTYYELYKKAEYQLEHNKINIGEFEKMIEPLNRDVETQTNTAEFEECDNPCIECGGNCCPDEDNDGNIHCKCAKVYFRKEPHTNTAEWKIVGKTTLHYECSKCGEAGDKWDKFCKHCGRKMTNAVAE